MSETVKLEFLLVTCKYGAAVNEKLTISPVAPIEDSEEDLLEFPREDEFEYPKEDEEFSPTGVWLEEDPLDPEEDMLDPED